MFSSQQKRALGRFFVGPLISIFTLLSIFLLLEIGTKISGIQKLQSSERVQILNDSQLNPDDAPRWCQPHPIPFPAPKDGFVRAFTLGGSSVHGCCGVSRSEAFPSLLNELLRPDFAYSVVDYSLSARDSFFMRDCVKSLISAGERPKYWIFYQGHNDFINAKVQDPRFNLFFQRYPSAFRLFDWLLKNSTGAGLLRFLNFRKPAFESPEKFQQNKEMILDQFKKNFLDLHARISASGSKLILLTLVNNLEYKPIRSVAKGVNWGLEKDADWLYAKGMELKAEGKYSESLIALRAARDWDLSGWRAPSEVNEFFRDFAKKNPDSVVLWDLEKDLDSFFEREGINCNFFGEPSGYCDFFHPNRRLHSYIAAGLAKRLRELENQKKGNL